MLGSVAEAEDLVQETFVRYQQAGAEAVAESPRSYLASITTRLAIDHLRSARVRRETYPGQWLPEPIVEQTPADHAETADSLSMAFLVLLEQLSPVERAVFLLREVFGYEFDEIARTVGRSEANCRQILVRARAHVSERRPRFESSPQKREELAQRFFAACRDGDQEALVGLLAADAAVYGDGGGKVHASPRADRRARARRARSHRLHQAGDVDGAVVRAGVGQRPAGRRLSRSRRAHRLGRVAGRRRRRDRRRALGAEPRQARAHAYASSACARGRDLITFRACIPPISICIDPRAGSVQLALARRPDLDRRLAGRRRRAQLDHARVCSAGWRRARPTAGTTRSSRASADRWPPAGR